MQARNALRSRSVLSCLEELRASPEERADVRICLVPSEGFDLAQMSVLYLDQRPWPEYYATLQYGINGRNDFLPRCIAAQLGRLQLGCEVVAIDETTHGAAVVFHDGQVQHIVRAANVVVAVPVPALRRITFAPPLAAEKTAVL